MSAHPAKPNDSRFYNRPELEGLLAIIDHVSNCTDWPAVPVYDAKDLAFKTLSTIEAIATIISLLVLLVFAFFMNPIVAYVISQALLQSGKGLMHAAAYWKKWRPSPVFALEK